LAPAVVLGGKSLKILWLFIVAPIVGGILGMVFYKVIYDD